MNKRYSMVAVVLSGSVLLGGCGSGLPTYPDAGNLPSPPLPEYQVGDIYVFDRGYVEKVTGIQGDKVQWESWGGELTYTSLRNFILPRLQWETPKGKGVAQFSEPEDTFWPLRVGENKRFFSKLKVTDKLNSYTKPFDQIWACSVPGTRKITVPAGVFDTWEISCERMTFPHSSKMQERHWYYAPAVGHYVLREDMYMPTSNRVLTYRSHELVAYLPADGNLGRKQAEDAERHFQQALEVRLSGEDSDWVSSDGNHRRKISLLSSFLTEEGKYCREFSENRQDMQRSRRHKGVACRSLDGHWRIAVATLPAQAKQP